jgi:hypothetical protein
MKKVILKIVKWTFIGTFVIGVFSALILSIDTEKTPTPQKQLSKEDSAKEYRDGKLINSNTDCWL